MDTTVIPPPGALGPAGRPYSLASLGSVLSGTFCPECDRDVSEPLDQDGIVLCETCVNRDDRRASGRH